MKKVLVSFMGTGPNNQGTSHRQYKEADYRFDDETQYKTSFVADALYKYYGIDKMILIGTPKSMWERVYEVFCDNRGIEKDEEYWLELAEHCDAANAKSALEIPQRERLEAVLGKDSHIALIHYGLNAKELQENASIILGLEQYLQKGDEVYLDITHSFRSLPLHLMNLLIYLKNVSPKQIKIVNILYGMLDVSQELGYTPVVNLSSVMDINEWVIGAYSFKQFGNGYKIAELMETQGEMNMATRLNKFSDLLNLNHLDSIRKQTQELSSIKNERHGEIADRIIPGVVNGFLSFFPSSLRQSTFQLRLAQWHHDHRNYSSAYIALVESIVTYVCEELGMAYDSEEDRGMAKRVLRRQEAALQLQLSNFSTLSNSFKKVNKLRNSVAHSIETTSNYTQMIKTLKDTLSALEQIIK